MSVAWAEEAMRMRCVWRELRGAHAVFAVLGAAGAQRTVNLEGGETGGHSPPSVCPRRVRAAHAVSGTDIAQPTPCPVLTWRVVSGAGGEGGGRAGGKKSCSGGCM
eukprot:1065901-Rhodomonas_salina.2